MSRQQPTVHRPAGPDLLRVARTTIESTLLPTLAGEQRYTALMLAHALAICEREWRNDAGLTADAGLAWAAGLQQTLLQAPAASGMPDEATWNALWQSTQARLLVDKGHTTNHFTQPSA